MSSIQITKHHRPKYSTPDNVPQRDRYRALVYEFADAKVRDAVLIAQDDEGPDRDPDEVDLADELDAAQREEQSERHKPVAADSSEEVDAPLALHIHPAIRLANGIC